MIGTAIEIIRYGDFDMSYTECVMITSEVRDVKSIKRAFEASICENDISNLESFSEDEVTNEFKKYLKKEGFRPLKMKSVTINRG